MLGYKYPGWNFVQKLALGSLTSLKISNSGHRFKSLSEDLGSGILRLDKIIDLILFWIHEPSDSRQARYSEITEKSQKPTRKPGTIKTENGTFVQKLESILLSLTPPRIAVPVLEW